MPPLRNHNITLLSKSEHLGWSYVMFLNFVQLFINNVYDTCNYVCQPKF